MVAATYWNNWHFIDHPINPTGMGFDNPIPKYNNLIDGLSTAMNVLTNNGETDLTNEKSMMLRMLIHLYGDISQPLHNARYYDEDFPRGDMGGNLQTVRYRDEEQNWHMVWDNCFGYFPEMERPMQAADRKTMKEFATLLTTNYPRSAVAEELKQKSPNDWSL